MALALSTVQKLRHDHRALAERLEQVVSWVKRLESKPTPPAWLAVCRLVAELVERLPEHLHEENCIRCSNYAPCRDARDQASSGCASGASEPKQHEGHQHRDELGQSVTGLAELVSLAGALPDVATWHQLSAKLRNLDRQFRAHLEDEEKSFRRRVLDQGRSRG